MRLDAAPDHLDGAGDSYHVSGRAWRNGHNAPVATWPAGEYEVFAPCAAAALYRRAAFEEIGGFDERFFCYFEDVDLGFRLRLRGHRCVYVPRCGRAPRQLGAERLSQRLRRVSRRAKRRLDLRQEHAGAAVLALPAAAPGAEPGGARLLSLARAGARRSGAPSAMRCSGCRPCSRERRAVQQRRRVEWRALRARDGARHQPRRTSAGTVSADWSAAPDRSAIEPIE